MGARPAGRRPPAVVIGVGNDFRRDDGVGPAVAGAVAARLAAASDGRYAVGAKRAPTDVEVIQASGEPLSMLLAWDARELVVIVDAVLVSEPGDLGQVMRFEADALTPGQAVLSSHAMDIPDALTLGRALGRVPARLVVIGIGASDFGQGPGLSDPVAAAIPAAVAAVLAAL